MTSFYAENELEKLGLKSFGKNVLISRKVSIYGSKNIEIGNDVRIDDFCILSGKITIGNNVHIAAGVHLFAGDSGIEIQDFAGISGRSAVYAESDDYSGEWMTNPTVPGKFRKVSGSKVILEKHALIGTGSTVLPGVTIGEGTSVGSMSLVTKSLAPGGMYAGIPCRFLKKRSSQLFIKESQYKAEKQKG